MDNNFSLDELKNENATQRRDLSQPRRTPEYESTEEIPTNRLSINNNAKIDEDSEYTTVDPHEIAGRKERIEESASDAVASIYADLDKAVMREKGKITQLQDNLMDDIENAELGIGEKDVVAKTKVSAASLFEEDKNVLPEENDNIFNESVSVAKTPNIIKETKKMDEVKQIQTNKSISVPNDYSASGADIVKDLGITDEDFFKDDFTGETSDDELKQQKMIDSIKSQAKENIKPIRDRIDLTKFTVRKEPIAISKLMSINNIAEVKIGDWAMYSQGRPISCSALTGMEITKLNPSGSSRTRLNAFKEIYKIIFDHVIDDNKPEFEAWLKTIHYHDLDHIYFALYKATFSGSNFVNFTCQNEQCSNVFIKDVSFEELVKYADDAAKEKVKAIMAMDTTTEAAGYENHLYQISDSYMVGLRIPSVWNVVIETASLSEAFLEKYAEILDLYSYIDEIYFIDRDNGQLIPVDIKQVANNQVMSISNRIRIYHSIISKLSSDQYYELYKYIRDMESQVSGITYQFPETICPECGAKIPATTMTAEQLLFTRHQLGALASM